MKNQAVALSLMIVSVLASSWLMPSFHRESARPAPHTPSTAAPVMTSGQSSCCTQDSGASSLHEGFCCEASPALPGAVADFGSYTPYLSLVVAEPQEQRCSFLAPPVPPPTL